MNERYLSLKEVAKIIGVTPLTLRNWDKKGILAAYRNPVNNYRVYRYADVADFVAEIGRTRPQKSQSYKIPLKIEEELDGDAAV
jgi:DNA (cytosine-5)-methyltransferase 1